MGSRQIQLPKKGRVVFKTRWACPSASLPRSGYVCGSGQLGFLLGAHSPPPPLRPPAAEPVLKDILRTGSFLGAFIRDFSWLSSPIEKWGL